MSLKKIPLPHFQISTSSVYLENESDPQMKKFMFAYKVEIKNLGLEDAQLVSRHWIITNAFGHTEEVKGPGVVGLQPKITPHQIFKYESACPLNTSTGTMRGYFSFLSHAGEPFNVEIPEFYLVSPHSVH